MAFAWQRWSFAQTLWRNRDRRFGSRKGRSWPVEGRPCWRPSETCAGRDRQVIGWARIRPSRSRFRWPSKVWVAEHDRNYPSFWWLFWNETWSHFNELHVFANDSLKAKWPMIISSFDVWHQIFQVQNQYIWSGNPIK